MNDLQEYFENNTGRIIDKWMHYFDVYERHFSKYRGRPVVILEIGVLKGGSLQMWRDYFGEQSRVYGIDVNPECKEYEEPGVQIFIGSQDDENFLKSVMLRIGQVDIIIDDGGHTMNQQITSFKTLYPYLHERGVYLVEDTHTSYWLKYGGGYRRPGTFIEFSKTFIDSINAWHSQQGNFVMNDYTHSIDSIHFYDSIVVVEKKPFQLVRPFSMQTGKGSEVEQLPAMIPVKRALLIACFLELNKYLNYFRIRSIPKL